MNRTHELWWWFGLAIWVALAVLWRPEPTPAFTEAPSALPTRSGFEIFYELVARDTRGVRRFLGPPADLPEDVGVLVLLSPAEPVPDDHLRQLLDWVADQGGTLVIGHPITLSSGGDLPYPLCPVLPFQSSRVVQLQTVGLETVPPFEHPFSSALNLDACDAGVLLSEAQTDTFFAAFVSFGSGFVIQLADATLLDNSALGWKQTHTFAAALIQFNGQEASWLFNEAYEGIRAEPRHLELIGASRYRMVFLQLILLGFLVYWYRSARLGPVLPARDRRAIREVATQAQDTGNFYLRAARSHWALARSYEYLKLTAKEPGASLAAKTEAREIIDIAEKELQGKSNDVEKHARIIRKMARVGRFLATNTKEDKK